MKTEFIDTLIVGAGQAGLATSEHLSNHGVPHLIIEKNRIVESWRSCRWDSLVANGPAWHDRFPTLDFEDHSPNYFAHKNEIIEYFENDQKIISSIRPGLSGVASIIFRDEEKILQNSADPEKTYQQKITPRKAELEKWYVKNKSLYLYFKLIILTIIVVIIPSVNMVRFFKDIK